MTNENRTPAGVPTGGQFAASARTEADLSLPPLSAAPREPEQTFTAVGDCPDCGEPMIGHVGDGRFVPGAECEHCHHTVMTYEWETEPNEDDRTYLYEVQDDALIRVTDEDGDTTEMIAPDDADWDKQVQGLGLDPDAFRRAHLAVTDQHGFVEAETERLGYAHLAGPYSVILDRERVAAHVLIARATDPDALHEDDGTIEGYAIDRLYLAEDVSEENVYEIDDERWAHVEAACDEAGLGVMKDIYESMANREILHRDQVKDAETVTNDYDTVVGPAIDRIEDALIDEHGEVEH